MRQLKIFLFLFSFLICHLSLAQTTASRTADFNNAQGINVQLRNIWNPYGDLTLVSNSLNYLGIKHIRDESPQDADLVNRFKILAGQGFKWDLIIGSNPHKQMNHTWLQDQLSMIKQVISAHPGSVVGLEGLNEPYNFPNYWYGTLTNNWSIVHEVQKAEFAAVNNDPVLANIPMLTPSLYPTAFSGTPINNGSYADLGNAHTYPEWAAQPGATLAKDFANQQNILAVGKPAWITEFGYSVTPSDHQWGVSETAQAKYIVNGLADAFKLGIGRIYIYHLIEYGDVSNPKPWGANAIFFADGRPKKAAVAVHNMNTVLADSGANRSSFTPGTLAYSLSGMPSTARSMLLQKSNGNFYLLLWNEVKSYDQATERDLYVAPVPVTVSLGSPAPSVRVFNTMVGTTPTQAFSNTNSFTVGVPDNVIILEIASTQGTQPSMTVMASTPANASAVQSSSFNLGYNFNAIPLSTDQMVFVHFLNSSGQIVFQDDHRPPISTSTWSGNVSYTRTISIPASVAAGTYSIALGIWDPATGLRTTMNAGAGVTVIGDNYYKVGNLSVTAPLPSYTLSVSSPSEGATVSGTFQVVGSGSGFLNVEVFNAAGTMIGRGTPNSLGEFSIAVDSTKLSNGSQTLTIRAWDSPAGQPATQTASVSRSVNVQNVPPSVTVLASTPAHATAVQGSSFNLSYNFNAVPLSTDQMVFVHFRNSAGQIVFQDDHRPPVSTTIWSGNVSYTRSVNVPASAAAGTYSIALGIWDPLTGLRTTLTPGAGVTVLEPGYYIVGSLSVSNVVALPPADTVAPAVVITSPANNAILARGSVVSVSASASDNVGVVDVKFYLNGSLICTDSSAAYQCQVRLPRKRQYSTIEAVARDAAGRLGRHSIRVYGR